MTLERLNLLKSSSKEPAAQMAEILADLAASPCLWDVVSDEREYNSRFSAGKFAGFEAVVLDANRVTHLPE